MTLVRLALLIWCFAGWFFMLLLPFAQAQEYDPEKVLQDYPEIRQAIEQKIIDHETLKNVLTLVQQGRYAEAIPLVEESLKKGEKDLGPEHAFTATAKEYLATLYAKLGKFAEAEPLQKQALAIRQKILGPEHLHTVTSMKNLAMLYFAMRAYDQALPLFQQTLQVSEKIFGPEDFKTAISLYGLAMVYFHKGAYAQALPLLKQFLLFNEKVLGQNDPATAISLNSLSELLQVMGYYDQALPLHKRALKIQEDVLGPDHVETIISVNDLALLKKTMGSYSEAEALYQRALKSNEKHRGPEHPATALSLNNLADLYQELCHYDKALQFLQMAIKIREKVLGTEHPDTIDSVNNLATIYKDKGNYANALPLLQRTLKIREKVLGPEHPKTAQSLNNLAELHKAMGAYDQAIFLHKRALHIIEQNLGAQHPQTATSLNNLATVYADMGSYDKAMELHQRALNIREKVFGPEHTETAMSLNNLASLYEKLGYYGKAIFANQMALNITEKILGPWHPNTAVTLSNLAGIYRIFGAYDKALPLYQRALHINEKVLGAEHPTTAISLNNLALLYQTLGSYEKALHLYQRTLKIAEQTQGPEHPTTALILSNLAELYRTLGEYDHALILQQRALRNRETILGVEHPTTAISLNNLALLNQKIGRYDQAFSLHLRALKIHEKVLGPDHPETALSLSNLGSFYLEKKDYNQAMEYLKLGRSKQGLVDIHLATGQAPAALEVLAGMAPSMKDSPQYHIQYHTQQGLSLIMVGRRREAALALDRAVQEIEQVRRRIREPGTGFFRAGSVGGYLRAYQGLVSALAEMAIRGEALPAELHSYGPDPGAAAFAVAEATKGRVLLESLATAARRQTRVEIPPELRQREEKLLHQMASLESQWEKAVAGGEEALKEVKARQENLRGELQALIKEIRQQHPLYAALHYPQPLPARDLPLKDREVLVEYALGDKASYVFVVRRGGVHKLIPIPLGREELAAKVKTFMSPFSNRQVNDFSAQQGKELHDLLLAAPLAEVKEGEAVIIVPDGILGLLPFEALVIQEGPGLKDHVYVGDRHTFTYYQSAAIMALQRRLQEHRAPRPLFALGHPVFSAGDPRYAAAHGGKPAAGTTLAKTQEAYAFRGLATRREWGQTTKDDQTGKALSFPPLPQTEQEVRAIAKTLGVKPEPPDVLLNLEANETRLRQAPLGKYRYVHFATHADLPGKVQGVNEPFILLGQVDNAEGDNGFLTMSEVLDLKLSADMVVLSACLTGRGQVMEGEGVANFARAFQQAGARSVVVSLWEVTSKETVDYMTLFYGHLQEGKSRSQALRLARQEIKAKNPHPFYWAAFILHGEG